MRNKKGQFKKGHIPPFKGIKGIHLSPKTEFKKGCVSIRKGKKHTKLAKEKIRLSHLGKKGYWLGKKRLDITGKNNWNWKGGISTENDKIRHSLEYKIWRIEVYKKDKYKCRLCGSKKDIVAHHLKLFSDFPELRFSVDNGITLCRSCHLKLHKYVMGIGATTNGTITIKDGLITSVTEAVD